MSKVYNLSLADDVVRDVERIAARDNVSALTVIRNAVMLMVYEDNDVDEMLNILAGDKK